MACITLALVAGWASSVSGLMQFINPPPFGAMRDFSNSETYSVGSTLNVAWTPAESGKAASLVLYQLDSNGLWFGDMEYLTQGAVGVTRYTWLVGTRKNLTRSNLFHMSIFQEGRSDSDGNSHYFYIAEKAAQQTSTATSSVPTPSASSTNSAMRLSTTSSTSFSSTTSELSRSPTGPPASGLINTPTATPQTPQSSTPPNGFPLAAKIGIGAGIPAALAIGLGIGFLLFRRRKKKDATFKVTTLDSGSPYSPDQNHKSYRTNGNFYGSNLNEAPPKSPVEMAPRRGESYYAPQHNHVPRQSPEVVTVRYEM